MPEKTIQKSVVAVMDVGVTCALGRTWTKVLNAMKSGQSGLAYEEIHGYPTATGRVHAVLPSRWENGIELDRGVALALDSIAQLKPLPALDARRCGVFWGVGIAGAYWLESSYAMYCSSGGDAKTSPWTVPMIMPNAAAALIAKKFGFTGGAWTQASACASSSMAIGQAFEAIRSGILDLAVVGGSDAMLTSGMLHAWARMRVMARTDADDAALACKPFAQERTGLCLAEGAACLVLMSAQLKEAVKLEPLAWLQGFGHSCDAFDLTVPHAPGQAHAIRAALLDAGIEAADVSYVCAHATGTRKGDITELDALQMAWGNRVPDCPISSIKSVTGHTMGASGALASVLTVVMLHDDWIAPTRHMMTPDDAYKQWNLPAESGITDAGLNFALVNSFGFGGSNACLVFKK